VGDYVLSPDICVERKALPDLIASLASGRLAAQAAALCRHYRTPVLLIEFEAERAFALQGVSEISDDIDGRALTSRLALLLLHFPRLRLVWSRRAALSHFLFLLLPPPPPPPPPLDRGAGGVPTAASASPPPRTHTPNPQEPARDGRHLRRPEARPRRAVGACRRRGRPAARRRRRAGRRR
jgi:DNA excision repair protein ERCC-4